MMPASVALEDPADPGQLRGLEPGGEPGLEASEVALATGEKAVAAKEIAQVLRGLPAVVGRVERLVGEFNGAVTQADEQDVDGGATLPGVDRLGSLVGLQ